MVVEGRCTVPIRHLAWTVAGPLQVVSSQKIYSKQFLVRVVLINIQGYRKDTSENTIFPYRRAAAILEPKARISGLM